MITSSAAGALSWIQPRAFRRWYELRRASELVAELRFPGLFTPQARATAGAKVWDIRGVGVHHNHVRMVRPGAPTPDVTFTRHWLWRGGYLDFPHYSPLRARIALFRRRLVLRTAEGERVLSLRYRGLVRSRGELQLELPRTAHDPDLLAIVSWYLVVTGLFQVGAEYGVP